MQIIIKGRIPSKKNLHTIITVRGKPLIIPSKRHKDWNTEQSWTLKAMKLDKTFTFCSIVMTIFFPDNRRADLSNKGETILDLLVDNNIIADDDWTCVNSLHYYSGGVDKLNPRAEIDIVDLNQSS